jgi:peptide/nickel transport system substrate-binding protein
MRKATVWLSGGGLALLSMLVAACGTTATNTTTKTSTSAPTTATAPATTTAKPTTAPTTGTTTGAEQPKYGGTLNLVLNADVVNWEPLRGFGGTVTGLDQEPLMGGDWAKGPAGGFGTNATDWGTANNDLIKFKTPLLATGYTWSTDAKNDTATVVFQIRKGVKWALNPTSEASRLVNGREMTTDDVVFTFKRLTTWPLAGLYQFRPEFHDAVITKTAPQEVTVTIKGTANLIMLVQRLADLAWIEPQEVIQKYGDMQAWDRQQGTGPFMISDYVQNSSIYAVRNPNYWLKDPVGPGKGNQLPYLDAVRVLVIPDFSTQFAALRTGKVDSLVNITGEDARSIKKTAPKLVSKMAPSNAGSGQPLGMRMDKPGLPWGPQDDPNAIKVRRAMMMAIDYQGILKNYFQGEGQIVTWPQAYVKEYAGVYLGLDDPKFPQSAKELYSYNPEKAKQLLTEAGYPNGFKCSAILIQSEVDYYSMVKDYWSKIGIDVSFDLRDPTTKTQIYYGRTYPQMITGVTGPVSSWYTNSQMWGTSWANVSFVDDPVINKGIVEARSFLPDDEDKAMARYKELAIYMQDKAWVIPNVISSNYYFWWPWIKNYSGEQNIGFGHYVWPKFIWYDKAMKQQMGF